MSMYAFNLSNQNPAALGRRYSGKSIRQFRTDSI
jgi:hypothetical protein